MAIGDTTAAAHEILIAGYRRMSPTQKLARVEALSIAIRELALVDIRRRHPNADARELKLRLASRILDAATMRRAFDWDPDTMGY
jgi:hypothetical protein